MAASAGRGRTPSRGAHCAFCAKRHSLAFCAFSAISASYYENTPGGGLGWCGVDPQDHFHPSRCGRPPAAGLTLLFFKVHLKDRSVRLHKDPRLGREVIGDAYDWGDMHHLHAVARSPYTKASLLPEAIGSLRVYEIAGELTNDGWDYLDFTFDQTVIVRVGRIGIVATLNDSTAAESAWSDRLDLIDGPLAELQLREIGAMFALENRDLIDRPVF